MQQETGNLEVGVFLVFTSMPFHLQARLPKLSLAQFDSAEWEASVLWPSWKPTAASQLASHPADHVRQLTC